MIRPIRMTVAQLKKHLDTRLNRMERRNGKRFASIDRRFTSIDRRFTSIDRRFTSIDRRFTSIDRRFLGVDARLASADARAESMNEKLDAILSCVKNTDNHTTRILDEHEQRLQALERG